MLILLSVITWGAALYSCLLFSAVPFENITIGVIQSVIIFFLMILFIVIRIIYSVKHKSDKVEIINALLPFLYFSFLLFVNHLEFGSGRTWGITGDSQNLGFLTAFGFPDTAALCGFYICSAIITVSFIFKYIHLLKKYKENINVKTMTATIMIAGYAVTKVIRYAETISGVIYLFVIFIYWLVYCFLLLFMKLCIFYNTVLKKY